MRDISIQAWKKCREGTHKTPCNLEDEDAFVWEISYPNMPYTSSTIDFDSLYKAQNVQSALSRVFEAGKKARSKEIGALIGVQ